MCQLQFCTNVILSSPIIQGGYHQQNVSYSSGQLIEVEEHSRDTLPSGYGSDDGGGHTVDLLLYLTERFGPVSSFSGSYRADRWTINIELSDGMSTVCHNGDSTCINMMLYTLLHRV